MKVLPFLFFTMVFLCTVLIWKGVQAFERERFYRIEPEKFVVLFPRYAPNVPKVPPHPIVKDFKLRNGTIFVEEEKPCFVIYLDGRYYTCSLNGKLLGLASKSDLMRLPFLQDVDIIDLELSVSDKKILCNIKDIIRSPILAGISLGKRYVILLKGIVVYFRRWGDLKKYFNVIEDSFDMMVPKRVYFLSPNGVIVELRGDEDGQI